MIKLRYGVLKHLIQCYCCICSNNVYSATLGNHKDTVKSTSGETRVTRTCIKTYCDKIIQ